MERHVPRKSLRVPSTYTIWMCPLMVVQISNVILQLYLPATMFTQMSIVLFNRRITGLASKPWRRINDGFLVILTIYLIAYATEIGVRCPLHNLSYAQLGKAENPQNCNLFQGLKLTLALAGIQVALHFLLLLTPIIVLWKVNMDRTRKAMLFVIFAIGSVSCISALMLIISQYQIHEDITCM